MGFHGSVCVFVTTFGGGAGVVVAVVAVVELVDPAPEVRFTPANVDPTVKMTESPDSAESDASWVPPEIDAASCRATAR